MDNSQPQIMTSGYQAPMHQPGGSMIHMTNPENELLKMELTLRSQILDDKGNPKRCGDPLMNDEGISSVMGYVQTVVNQVTIMSNLNRNEISGLMDFLSDTLANDLMLNRERYNIQTASARSKIFFTALTSAFITMKRAYEGDDKRFWKGSQQEITMRNESPDQGKGIMHRLNPFSR